MLISSSYLKVNQSVRRFQSGLVIEKGDSLLLESHVSLLHGVDLFPDELHLTDLRRDWEKWLAEAPRLRQRGAPERQRHEAFGRGAGEG